MRSDFGNEHYQQKKQVSGKQTLFSTYIFTRIYYHYEYGIQNR